MGVIEAILPVLRVGGIVVYVIGRLKHKHTQDNLNKEKSKGAQELIGSLLPLGMLLGCAVGVIVGIFFPRSLLYAVIFGSAIGYLLGYFAYAYCS